MKNTASGNPIYTCLAGVFSTGRIIVRFASVPFNQNQVGWPLNDIDHHRQPQLSGDIQADWVIVGSGYAGVSFARRLASLNPQ
ncbi:FAD-dependent oxidoreductase, partial [Klebsiella grimontii]|nr:FAD-dependent oxidoreductase [Klebsiella grimontii]